MEFRLKFSAPKKPNPSKNFALTDPVTYETELSKTQPPDTSSANSNTVWSNTKSWIINALSSQPKMIKRKNHWFSDNTMRLIQERQHLKKKTCSTNNYPSIIKLNKNIQAACRRDRNKYLQDICAEIEQHANRHQTKDLFIKIR